MSDVELGLQALLANRPAGRHREAVRTFLENVVQVTGTLEASRQEAAIAKLADIFLPDPLADVLNRSGEDRSGVGVLDAYDATAGELGSAVRRWGV